MESDSLDVSISGKKKQPSSYLKLWKISTLVSVMVAVAVTAVLIWYVQSSKSELESIKQEDTNIQDTLECPKLPTLLPLPKPTPERITGRHPAETRIDPECFSRQGILTACHFYECLLPG